MKFIKAQRDPFADPRPKDSWAAPLQVAAQAVTVSAKLGL